MFQPIIAWWKRFEKRHETGAQFLVFFIVSNGVTILQALLMPIFKWGFGFTSLVAIPFQFLPIGMDGERVLYMFDYAAGPVRPDGLGGGLAYFLAVEITLLIAQVINFYAQRNITFKSNVPVWWAAMWYAIAYVFITIFAAWAQVLYKGPIYAFFQNLMGHGPGQTTADMITMLINSMICFWVFFPIFKVIFRSKEESPEEPAQAVASV
ncbi:MAG: hypothetical protein Q4C87_10095 [Actinomycetaceae bacterium]|nr:hypothetical protein [Actinomycetaceae bacterium]